MQETFEGQPEFSVDSGNFDPNLFGHCRYSNKRRARGATRDPAWTNTLRRSRRATPTAACTCEGSLNWSTCSTSAICEVAENVAGAPLVILKERLTVQSYIQSDGASLRIVGCSQHSLLGVAVDFLP